MLLLVCSDCQSQFSDAAQACPRCGRPNLRRPLPVQSQPDAVRSLGTFFIGGGCLLVLGLSALGLVAQTCRKPTVVSSAPAESRPTAAEVVTAQPRAIESLAEFEKDAQELVKVGEDVFIITRDGGASTGDVVRVPAAGRPQVLVRAEKNPQGLAGGDGWLAWRTIDESSSAGGGHARNYVRIMRSTGGSVRSVLISEGYASSALAVVGGVAYAQRVAKETTSETVKIELASGSLSVLTSMPKEPRHSLAVAFAATKEELFWTQEGDFFKVPLAGGTPVSIATDQAQGLVFALAVDAERVYFSDRGRGINDGRVAAVSREPNQRGGLVASGQELPLGMLVDGDYLYWANNGRKPGGVYRWKRVPGTAPVEFAVGEGCPTRLAADATHIYWLNACPPAPAKSVLRRAPK
jgi:hypothetical protein